MNKNMILFDENKAIVSNTNGNMEFRDNVDNLQEILRLENYIEELNNKYELVNRKMLDLNEIRVLLKVITLIIITLSILSNLIMKNFSGIIISLPITGGLFVTVNKLIFNNIKTLSTKRISILNIIEKYKDNLKEAKAKSKPIEYDKDLKEQLSYNAVSSVSFGINDRTNIENEIIKEELNYKSKVRIRK